jgi:2-C-methyl-D-erythritol 4-phosphate cytidylyltransferase
MDVSRGPALVLLAGGRGLRAGGAVPKQFVTDRRGRSVLMRCLIGARAATDWEAVVVVAPESDLARARDDLRRAGLLSAIAVAGGERRLDSLLRGLAEVNAATSPACVIHDGTRPFTPVSLYRGVLAALESGQVDAAWPVSSPTNAVLAVDGPTPRPLRGQDLQLVSTPVAVRTALVQHVIARHVESDSAVVPLLMREGVRGATVADSPLNFKVTTAQDLLDTLALMDAESEDGGGDP